MSPTFFVAGRAFLSIRDWISLIIFFNKLFLFGFWRRINAEQWTEKRRNLTSSLASKIHFCNLSGRQRLMVSSSPNWESIEFPPFKPPDSLKGCPPVG